MPHKHARTRVPVNSLISKRWSSRAYDETYQVSKKQILALAEAARWAPSSDGVEPWRIVFFHRESGKDMWQRAIDCLNKSNQSWAKRASLLILICAETVHPKYNVRNRWAEYDTGAAAENLSLQATDLGLTARQIGGFDEVKTRESFQIPDQLAVMAFVAVGKQTESDVLTYEKHIQEETGERHREPMESNFFINGWNGLTDDPVEK